MTMVATDSYRLAVKRTEVEGEGAGELEANIPARALRELGRILQARASSRSRSRCCATRRSSAPAPMC